MGAYRAKKHPEVDEELAAPPWVTDVFDRITGAISREFRGRLEAAQIVHEVLGHRWHVPEARGSNVLLEAAVAPSVEAVLRHRRDGVRLVLDPDGK